MTDEYTIYYVKTTCKHCGEEIVIKVYSKTPIVNVEQELLDENTK